MLFGNSITAGAETSGWFTTANLQAGSPTTQVRNAGVGGNRTDEMLSRITADVLAYDPDITIVEGGGNDITQGRTSAQVIASLTDIYDELAAAGSRIIATTVLPSGFMNTAGEHAAITEVNTWIRATYSAWPGAYLCDWNPMMTDGVNEWTPHAGYTDDDVHPNTTGAAVMAGVLRPVLLAAAT